MARSRRKELRGEGCIEGMRCPECDNYEHFKIVGTQLYRVSADGTDDAGGDIEWGDESYAEVPECGHRATAGDFREATPELRHQRLCELTLRFRIFDQAKLLRLADAAISLHGAGVESDPKAPLASRVLELLLHSNPAVPAYNDLGLELLWQRLSDG